MAVSFRRIYTPQEQKQLLVPPDGPSLWTSLKAMGTVFQAFDFTDAPPPVGTPVLKRVKPNPKSVQTMVDLCAQIAGNVVDGTFACDDNARRILEKRYLAHETERPEDWLARVAARLALVELSYRWENPRSSNVTAPIAEADRRACTLFEDLYALMLKKRFLPGGRTSANADGPIVPNWCAGRSLPVCLSPLCSIVLHIPDTMEGIFGTLKEAAILQQHGSGLGFPFSGLRPAGYPAKTCKGTASGPCSFLRCYASAFLTIKQMARHGANMSVLSVNHPDILEFIHVKDKEGDLTCFNISVGLTEEFMRRVADPDDRQEWTCTWDGKKTLPRRIERDADYRIVKITPVGMTAGQIFAEIVDSAWRKGEPGVVFLDQVNKNNPLPGVGRIQCCNPCGGERPIPFFFLADSFSEQFLHDGDVWCETEPSLSLPPHLTRLLSQQLGQPEPRRICRSRDARL